MSLECKDDDVIVVTRADVELAIGRSITKGGWSEYLEGMDDIVDRIIGDFEGWADGFDDDDDVLEWLFVASCAGEGPMSAINIVEKATDRYGKRDATSPRSTWRSIPTEAIQELVDILSTKDLWRFNDIHDEYKHRHPDDPCAKNRAAAIRNKLQRHCSTSKQYQRRFPLFENPSKGLWKLASNYRTAPSPIAAHSDVKPPARERSGGSRSDQPYLIECESLAVYS
jgi:hypothetical protein